MMSEEFRENTTKEVGGGGRMEIVRLLGGGFKYVLFPSLFVEDSHFD